MSSEASSASQDNRRIVFADLLLNILSAETDRVLSRENLETLREFYHDLEKEGVDSTKLTQCFERHLRKLLRPTETGLSGQPKLGEWGRGRELNPGARLHRPIGYQATSPRPLFGRPRPHLMAGLAHLRFLKNIKPSF